jgi:microcompartment protein CcmK/EutM
MASWDSVAKGDRDWVLISDRTSSARLEFRHWVAMGGDRL